MGHFYDEIPEDLFEWIQKQPLFHVATAPLEGGHINVSPKSVPNTFHLVNPKACWYLDLSGSGVETIAHIYQPGNGRVTVLFEAFEGAPKLLRIYGIGKVFERGSPEFNSLVPGEVLPGARAIIWIDIQNVGTSCGFSVPKMKFVEHRDTLNVWADKRQSHDRAARSFPFSSPSDWDSIHANDHTSERPVSTRGNPTVPAPPKGIHSFWVEWNAWSVDWLPGLKFTNGVAKNWGRECVEKMGLPQDTIRTGGKMNLMQRIGISLGKDWLVGFMMGFLMAVFMMMIASQKPFRGPGFSSLPLKP